MGIIVTELTNCACKWCIDHQRVIYGLLQDKAGVGDNGLLLPQAEHSLTSHPIHIRKQSESSFKVFLGIPGVL